jgi:hypothetical protein
MPRLVSVLLGCALGLSHTLAHQRALPDGYLGLTYCTPLGAMMIVDTRQNHTEREMMITAIHEAVHGLQCRRDGIAVFAEHTLDREAAANAEAEAFATEQIAQGIPPTFCTLFVVETLTSAYPSIATLPTETIHTIAEHWCNEIGKHTDYLVKISSISPEPIADR